MNLIDEKREVRRFKTETNPEAYMTTDDLVTLATKGFETCPDDSLKTGDYCASRKYSGDDACSCIRAVFPNPDYYELYQLMREYYLENLGKASLRKIIGTDAYERTTR